MTCKVLRNIKNPAKLSDFDWSGSDHLHSHAHAQLLKGAIYNFLALAGALVKSREQARQSSLGQGTPSLARYDPLPRINN